MLVKQAEVRFEPAAAACHLDRMWHAQPESSSTSPAGPTGYGSQSSDQDDNDAELDALYDLSGDEFEAALDAYAEKARGRAGTAQEPEEDPQPPEPSEAEQRADALTAEAEELANNPDGALTPTMFKELMEQGQPHEVVLQMAQRMGSILESADFMEAIGAVSSTSSLHGPCWCAAVLQISLWRLAWML